MDTIVVNNYNNNIQAYFFGYNNCVITNELKKNNKWEPFIHEVFDKYITDESIIIEGGCHIGTHTVKLGMIAKHVYGFEPYPSSYNLLYKNIEMNNLNNVTILQKGLSKNFDRVKFDWTGDKHGNPGGSGLSDNPIGRDPKSQIMLNDISVELTTIDSLNLKRVDFIKLDIEGYEINAIMGGINTIKKYKPIIVLEDWCDHYGNFNINSTKEKFKILIDMGYNITQIGKGTPDFLFIMT
jgi:FkbM family methyltransferase